VVGRESVGGYKQALIFGGLYWGRRTTNLTVFQPSCLRAKVTATGVYFLAQAGHFQTSRYTTVDRGTGRAAQTLDVVDGGLFMATLFSTLIGVPKIKSPTLGVLDLSEPAPSQYAVVDLELLGPLFSKVRHSAGAPPKCDVLFIYCAIDQSGGIARCDLGLREIIRDSGANVVVVATENGGKAYIAAAPAKRYGKANLVMTLDRRGAVFGQFFFHLFTEMKLGTSMPVAWVKLAPQIPGKDHSNCPSTIFACEVGQLAFG
jgi:hypothetical protein